MGYLHCCANVEVFEWLVNDHRRREEVFGVFESEDLAYSGDTKEHLMRDSMTPLRRIALSQGPDGLNMPSGNIRQQS